MVNARLFEIYSEIKEPDKALIAWNNMAQNPKSEESNLIRYFNLKKSLNDTVVCDSVSEKYELGNWAREKKSDRATNRFAGHTV